MSIGAVAAVAVAFCVTLLAIVGLRPLAVSLDWLDRPGGHKAHEGEVPLVGGVAMFLGIVTGIGLLDPTLPGIAVLAGVCAILLVVGLLDDRFGLSAWTRLAVHGAAAAAMIAGTDAIVTHLGNPFGTGAVVLRGAVAFVFTLLLIVAAINAFNMLDGMDGLAGVTALTTLIGLAFIGKLYGCSDMQMALHLVVAASICAFLLFNIPVGYVRAMRTFMGDAGSTLLGALVAWFCIRTSQVPSAGAVHPVTVLWIIGLPLIELFWTVIRRVLRGRSPMEPDREHLHHLLLDAGYSSNQAFVIFALLNLMLLSVGAMLDLLRVPEVASLALLVLAGILLVRTLYYICRTAPLPATSDAAGTAGVRGAEPRPDGGIPGRP